MRIRRVPHEKAVRQDVLLQLESDIEGDISSRWPELWPRSSSIISEANLSSSLIQLSVEGSGFINGELLLQLPNSTFLSQFASACLPVFFCHIPRLDCSVSKHKHVSDCSIFLALSFFFTCCCCTKLWSCEAKYQRWSFAVRVADSIWVLGFWGAFGSNGKLVRARIPHMSRAASSYACAASSAVSKVPSQTLVFLQKPNPGNKCYKNWKFLLARKVLLHISADLRKRSDIQLEHSAIDDTNYQSCACILFKAHHLLRQIYRYARWSRASFASTIGLSHYQNPAITSFRLLGPCSCCGSIRTVLIILPRGNRDRSHSSDSATAYNLSPEYMQLEKELVGMTRSSWYPSIDKMCGYKDACRTYKERKEENCGESSLNYLTKMWRKEIRRVQECTREGDVSPIPKSPSVSVALLYISESVPCLWTSSRALSLLCFSLKMRSSGLRRFCKSLTYAPFFT